MLRKGFTLIELLIVITIIAILAGAAIPYVADYVEQSKVARCKIDMSRVRDALTRWELDRGIWPVTEINAGKLVGPYLQKAAVDPFGQPYVIDSYRSVVYSKGPNQTDDKGGGDDIVLSFRPRMAATKVQWVDNTGDGTIDAGDSILISCTRPVGSPMADTNVTQVKIAGQALKTFTAATGVVAQDRKLSVILTSTHASFVPGCNVTVVAGTDQNTSVNDETTLSPAGLTWTSAQALKADALLVLQSE